MSDLCWKYEIAVTVPEIDADKGAVPRKYHVQSLYAIARNKPSHVLGAPSDAHKRHARDALEKRDALDALVSTKCIKHHKRWLWELRLFRRYPCSCSGEPFHDIQIWQKNTPAPKKDTEGVRPAAIFYIRWLRKWLRSVHHALSISHWHIHDSCCTGIIFPSHCLSCGICYIGQTLVSSFMQRDLI